MRLLSSLAVVAVLCLWFSVLYADARKTRMGGARLGNPASEEDYEGKMSGTKMSGTKMSGTKMSGTKKSGNPAPEEDYEGKMSGTKMSGTKMSGTKMSGTKKSGKPPGVWPLPHGTPRRPKPGRGTPKKPGAEELVNGTPMRGIQAPEGKELPGTPRGLKPRNDKPKKG